MEEHAPACRASCPLHVDIREICRLIRTGSGSRARDLFFTGAVLPRITAAVCDAPCMQACRMREKGGSVQIGAIERALISDPSWNPSKLSLRFRSEDRVCVVGTGASGLTAIQALLARGFLVTAYEAEEYPGFKFREDFRIGPEKRNRIWLLLHIMPNGKPVFGSDRILRLKRCFPHTVQFSSQEMWNSRRCSKICPGIRKPFRSEIQIFSLQGENSAEGIPFPSPSVLESEQHSAWNVMCRNCP